MLYSKERRRGKNFEMNERALEEPREGQRHWEVGRVKFSFCHSLAEGDNSHSPTVSPWDKPTSLESVVCFGEASFFSQAGQQ